MNVMNDLVTAPERQATMRLHDGRVLAWSEWGRVDGLPVLFCTGAAMSGWLGFGANDLTQSAPIYWRSLYFVVEVPSLPGCISQGKTREEAIANIEEAITLYIEVLQDRGEPIPNDTVEVVLV